MINERIVIEEKTKDYNEAWIETYFWQESEELYPGQKRPVIVICPGGAYGMTSDREAEAIAVRFMGMGYHTVVLRYSVAPARYPVALRQLAKTVALLRENSDKWHIEKNKIIVSGFSAGGHLAASLATLYSSDKTRPDFQILFYPVISMQKGVTHGGSRKNLIGENPSQELEQKYSLERQVSPRTPQAFIMLSSDDDAVPPINGIGYFLALRDHKVPASLHAYPTGGHGWGFRDNFTYKRQWTEELEKWLREGLVFPVSELTTKK